MVANSAERSSLILLVDDFEDALDIYGQYLTRRGHRVVIARNGPEAVQSAHAHRPDIILLDLAMPSISGIDVVRTLRADRTFAKRPIVALTARALEGERLEALRAGFDEVIPKPCLPDELADSVQRMLNYGAARARVLLASDIDDQAAVYQAALEREGFLVRRARFGSESLEIGKAMRPACAVVDPRLPDMSGWDLCKVLKAERTTSRVRIIVLTQEVTPDAVSRSTKVGCHGWLMPPPTGEDLAATVRQVLSTEHAAPMSVDEALLGVVACPACGSSNARAGARVAAALYYCCQHCRFCWRVDTASA